MEPSQQPEPAPAAAPCAPDSALDPVYDSARNGYCANGHPLNSAGRCAVINAVATDAELRDAHLVRTP
jgi:hypothetical protein